MQVALDPHLRRAAAIAHKDFAVQRRANEGETVTFTLNGQTYSATPDLPGHALLTAASLQGASPIQQMQSMGTFLDLCLLPESRELFEANMKSSDPTCNITLEDAAEVVKWLLEEVYVGRPTQSASGSRGVPSPDGTSTTATASTEASTPTA